MSAPLTAVAQDEARRWQQWQDRGFAGDRRRGVAMKWVMAALAIVLGVMFGALL